MNPTNEQFEAVRRVKAEADNLLLVITSRNVARALVHTAFDPKVKSRLTNIEAKLLRKMK